jgi:predicted nicotinamide N-methyase
LTALTPVELVLANTSVRAPSLVPEVKLHLADELLPLWRATETDLADLGLPPPYWAFAWPGGQALARHLLDHPELVQGKRVLDFGAGAGIGAIAAARAGAAAIVAAEIDPFAAAAIELNAALNGASVGIARHDVLDQRPDADVILIGDMCYERPLAERLTRWMFARAAEGRLVLLADPGRAYVPRDGLVELARHVVPTSLELESRTERETIVYRVQPEPVAVAD